MSTNPTTFPEAALAANNTPPVTDTTDTTSSNPTSTTNAQSHAQPGNEAGVAQQDEYPEQHHAGAVGYGPNYRRGPGMEEKIGGTIEEIKGKILNKPDLAEHGHLRKTGELQKREEEKKDASAFAAAGGKDEQAQAATVAPEGTEAGTAQRQEKNAEDVKTIG